MLDIKKMLTKISKQMKEEKRDVSSQYVSACSLTKSGNVVQLVVTNVKNLPNQGTTLLTIPEGFRPKSDTAFDLIQPRVAGASFGYFLRCTARADGRLSVYNYSGSAISGESNCYGSITYIVETGGGGYCLNGLKAVFSMLSAIAERRWHHVKHQEDTHQTAAGCAQHLQRRRPVECYRLCKRIPSDTIKRWMARCERRHRQRGDDSTDYSYHVGQQGHGRADRHHLCRLGGIRVLLRQEGRDLHYRNLQVFTQGGVSCLTGVALSEGGCF